jgi:small conductance mechanosensitive channel
VIEWFDKLQFENALVSGVIVTAVELALLLALYLVLNGALRLLASRVRRVPALEAVSGRIVGALQFVRMLARLGLALLAVAVIGLNAYQVYLGNDVREFASEQLARIPPGFWVEMAGRLLAVIALAIAARFLIRAIAAGLATLRARALEYRRLRSNDRSVNRVFDQLGRLQRVLVWLLVLYAAARLFLLPDAFVELILIALRVYLIIGIGLLIVNAVAAIVDSLDGLSQQYAESTGLIHYYQQLRHLIPLLRRTLEYIVYASVATLVLTQLEFIAHLANYGPGVIQGIGLVFLARVAIELVNLVIDRSYLHEDLPEDTRQRNETIFPIVKSIAAGIIYFLTVVLILRGLGFDPIPLLAGAGVLGIVVGLGAQSLVNDIVSGFFIIFEDAFQVGDFVRTGEARGTVEQIALRTTRIRSPDGELHILRNGSLGNIVNYSRQYTLSVVSVSVAEQSDLEEAYRVLERVGTEFAEAEPDVLEPTRVDGIEDFSGLGVTIRTRTRVAPGQHDRLARALRQRIKAAFDAAGIELAMPPRGAPKPA